MKTYRVFQISLFFLIIGCKSSSNISTDDQNAKTTFDEDKVFWDPYQGASFPGGELSMFCFLSENLNSKIVSNDTLNKGNVFVKFKIDTVGKISKVQIIRGYNAKIDSEIVRVITLMPNWEPLLVLHGKLRTGKWVKNTCSFMLPLKIPYTNQCH
jgi:hypothetical protein